MRPASKRSCRLSGAALLILLIAGGTGCSNEQNGVRDEGSAQGTTGQSPTDNSDDSSDDKHVDLDLTDKVCHLNEPSVLIRVSGVSGSPKGDYYTVAQYRTSNDDDWSSYPLEKYDPTGSSEKANSMVNWHWSCTADKNTGVNDEPGEYRFMIYWPNREDPVAKTDWKMITVK